MDNKYFDKKEFYIKKIYFRSEGIVYRGSGVLLWNPETGFRLISQVNGEPVPKLHEFKSIEILKPLRIYLEISSNLERNLTAITPFLTVPSHDLLLSQPFTLSFGRITFFSKNF